MSESRSRHVVVGSGSIARRHLRNLKHLYPDGETACVSASGRVIGANDVGADLVFADVSAAAAWRPEFAVIASPAPWHLTHALAFLEAGVPTLIEKPLAADISGAADELARLRSHAARVDIAYPLRHLSSAVRMRQLLQAQQAGTVLSVMCEVGQYLPDWRPDDDYRKNVSAQRRLGGGALLELSHEFDYLRWLFGDFADVQCALRNTGQLDVDVEDCVDALLRRSDGLVAAVHLDFLQRTVVRRCKVVGSAGTLHWDLALNRIDWEGPRAPRETLFSEPGFDRNEMYLHQLRHFREVASGRSVPLVAVEDGIATLALVDALRRADAEGQRIKLKS